MSELAEKQEKVAKQLKAVSDQVKEKEASISALQSRIGQVSNSVATLRNDISTADKRAEYANALYSKISNITWNDNTSPTEIGGCTYRWLKFSLFKFSVI